MLITHEKLRDVTIDIPAGYDAIATIKHRSGIENAQLYYTTNMALDYEPLEMSVLNADEDTWITTIPWQPDGTTVQYYIAATANSGKNQVRPLPAPAGYFEFEINLVTAVENVDILPTQLGDIYPNPASAITVIPVISQKAQYANIELQDALGQTVEIIFDGEMEQGENQYFLFANRYPAGTYFVVVQTEAGRVVEKLVIQ